LGASGSATAIARAYRVIVEGACDHRTRSQNGVHASDGSCRRDAGQRVLADIEGGRRAGVHVTPTFFLDGERVDRTWRELPQIVRASVTAPT
jgi:hypothetical protein